MPVLYAQGAGGEAHDEAPDYAASRALRGQRLIVNPGSVGQPRDNNPDAAYACLDTTSDVWQYCRVPYNVFATQSRMRAARLPERLAARLGFGW
jgi:diadenosine tetraphosphatase ApaH/serine/threonine PP2A family protein phosphatase